MPSFHVENFGCRATQADGAAIERQLLEQGLEPAAAAAQASVVVLNTCTVTAAADRDARAAVRRIQRQNPECKILVTGCYAQRAPQELAALPGVKWVVGNSHKHEVGTIVSESFTPTGAGARGDFVPLAALDGSGGAIGAHAFTLVGDIFAHTTFLTGPTFDEGNAGAGWHQTRPNLKVQDGCDNRCSFCVIPSVRGHSRSLPLENVLREVNQLVAAGYREVVLSGINLGRWGRDLADGGSRFERLVEAILERTRLEKLRLSSVEPMDWSDELIAMLAGNDRIAKHAHLPLQSGSDPILRSMHRKYRPWHYAERAEKIRAQAPDAAIGADVMVGFPGESDKHFEETRAFIEGLPFTYLHIFTYSARPGTASESMSGQVPARVSHERANVLRQLVGEQSRRFREGLVGKQLAAITLRSGAGAHGHTQALTDNFVKMRIEGELAANRWVTARVTEASQDGLVGRVADEARGAERAVRVL